MNNVRRLYRSSKNRMLGGVCFGLADYLNIDPTIVRIAWVLFTAVGGAGLLAYIICWIIIPENPVE
jgi:phage shock protein PspC (stress-responsive transcriptional regulator)